MKNKQMISFRRQTKRTFIFIAVFVLIFVLFYNFFSFVTQKMNSEIFNGYEAIQDYYSRIDDASSYIKGYLTSDSEELLQNYEYSIQRAKEAVDELNKDYMLKDQWRFHLLGNMLKEYETIVQKLLNEYKTDTASTKYRQVYSEFIHTTDLIYSTSSSYYTTITESMTAHQQIISIFQKATFLGSAVLLFIIIIAFIYYNYLVTHSISQPFEKILQNIEQIQQGKYEINQITSGSQEFETLCIALNKMAKAVSDNVENIKEKGKLEKLLLEEKNDNLKKDELLAQSELKMLQNQINPHFLFNTLNMIYRMSLNAGADEAADMIIKTSHLLRYGLDSQNQNSSLQAELEMIQKYIDIQKKRLGDRVQFILELESEKIPFLQMPGMILQPLVENSLIHGLHDVIEGGEIVIHIGWDANHIDIIVSDNGKGMNSSQLEELIINDYQIEDGKHLGMYNVMKRLEMYFKDKIDIHIHSEEDCGFEVCICVYQ